MPGNVYTTKAGGKAAYFLTTATATAQGGRSISTLLALLGRLRCESIEVCSHAFPGSKEAAS